MPANGVRLLLEEPLSQAGDSSRLTLVFDSGQELMVTPTLFDPAIGRRSITMAMEMSSSTDSLHADALVNGVLRESQQFVDNSI